MPRITYREAINEALREELLRDENVFLMGEDIGKHGGAFAVTKGLWDEFGSKRIKDTPISENTIVGCGVGAAITGMRPVIEIMFMDFVTLALDQIVNHAAKIRYLSGGQQKVPLVIRTQQGGGGEKGTAAQHSQCLEAWFVHVPGLKVVLPSTPCDAKGLLKASIRDDNPVIYIEHKNCYPLQGEVPQNDYIVPLGRADIKRKGKDVTVIANGLLLHSTLKVAEELKREGVEVEVIDPLTFSPLDKKTITDSVKKTGRAVIVHEACKTGGIGGEIGMIILEEAFDYLDAPIQRVGALDAPISFSLPEEMRILPDEKRIKVAIRKVLE
ncbi:2-oxoisovalerate dehydrogenase subunit beta [subsurface metagenome]